MPPTSSILRHFLLARARAVLLQGPALERFQEARARESVRYALEHSPFYRAYWAGHDPERWRTLPAVERWHMHHHFEGMNTVGLGREQAEAAALEAETGGRGSLGDLTVGFSSGTGGQRGLFVVGLQEQAAWTGTVLARVLSPIRPERVALFLRAGSDLYAGVQRGRLLQFRHFALSADLGPIRHALEAYSPTLLLGPPSMLERLADARVAGRLRLNPRRVIAVAEVLEPQDRVRLEAAFGVRLERIYQATEGFLAATCTHGSLHLQEDGVAVQLEPLGDGLHFTPTVTDLWRRVQPIVRYRLGDLLRLEGGACGCGSGWRRISVEGRLSDLPRFEGQDGQAVALYPEDIRRMLRGVPMVEYRAVQERPGQLRLHLALEGDPPDPTALTHLLTRWLEAEGLRGVQLELDFSVPLEAPQVKRRRLIRRTP